MIHRKINPYIALFIITLAGSSLAHILIQQSAEIENEITVSAVVYPHINAKTALGISNWKTYRNEEYGFEIKYPPEWNSVNNEKIQSEILALTYQIDKKICGHGVGCSYPGEIFVSGATKEILVPYGSPVPIKFEDFIEKYNEGVLEGKGIIGPVVMLDDHKTIQIDTPDNLVGPLSALVSNVTLLVEYSADSVILLEADYFPEYREKIMSEFNTLVSTLRFVDSTALIDTSTWKTYRNEKYWFDIRYPSDWFVETRSGVSLDQTFFRNVQEHSELSDESLRNESSFLVQMNINANPKNLDLESWFAEQFKNGFSSEPLSKIQTSVDEKLAIRIEVSEIGRRFHFYILNGKNVVEIAYPTDLQPQFADTYQEMLLSFKI